MAAVAFGEGRLPRFKCTENVTTQLSEITFNYEMREIRESAWLTFSRLSRIS